MRFYSLTIWTAFVLLLCSCKTATGPQKWVGYFHSQIPAKADFRGRVDGTVYYGVYHPVPAIHGNKKSKPIQSCVLQHGYGVTQDVINAGLALKSGTAETGIAYSPLDLFTSQYFGMPLVDELLSEVCEEVVVPVQETNNTTLMEMVLRTEKFLKHEICRPATKPKQKSCAFIGHSMGGAVAFVLARRCEQGRSTLGKEGCELISKFYSATGVIQGASIPALLYGTKSFADGDLKEAFQTLSDSYSKFLTLTGSAVWDLDSDLGPHTNPTWYALSPTHPMEDNVPLFLANDWELKKRGWLVADFAASATDFDFTDNSDLGLVGCGNRGRPNPKNGLLFSERWLLQTNFCKTFGKSLALIHNDLHRNTFERGVDELLEFMKSRMNFKNHPGGLERIRSALNWRDFNKGDGFADFHLALDSCRKGLGKPDSAVRKCTTFSSVPLNHQASSVPLNHQASAGGALEAVADIVTFLKTNYE